MECSLVRRVFAKNGKIILDDALHPALNEREVPFADAFSVISSGADLSALKKDKKEFLGFVLDMLEIFLW